MVRSRHDSESDDDQILYTRIMEAKEETHLLPQMEEEEKPRSMGDRIKNFVMCNGYPLAVFLILVNEFCERFSFYGMRTVLTLYLKNRIGLGRGLATELFHAFNTLCYLTPLFGAVLADGFIGKYRTILYLSIVYGIGNLVMSLTAIPPSNLAGPLIGLMLIGVGTGGIKPCVSAFGGDQFSEDQTAQIARFFSVFYFVINAGSFFSTFITPILREDVTCFGGNCYFAAFGLPAVLMLISIVVFVSGRNQYKIRPPTGNVIGQFFCSIGHALREKVRNRGVTARKESSFIYLADNKYERTFLEDVESVLAVLLMFVPLPVFWALYDQQGSTWTLQAERMDGDIGFMVIKPDQMQAINTVLIILFIPLFEGLVYPLLNKCRIPNRPLQRMAFGMGLAALSFVISGFVQLSIENQERPDVQSGEMRLRFVNTLPCGVQLSGSVSNELLPSQAATQFVMTSLEKGNDVTVTSQCRGKTLSTSLTVELRSEQDSTVYVTESGGHLAARQVDSLLGKPQEGNSKLRVLCLRNDDGGGAGHDVIMSRNDPPDWTDVVTFSNISSNQMSEYLILFPGRYHVFIGRRNDTGSLVKLATSVGVRQGGVYSLVLEPETASQIPDVALYVDIEANTVSMLLQVPQYVVITAGEILFSITGLSFAYAEAPASMKSVVQSFWLVTMGIGNLLVMIFVAIHVSDSVAVEMFFYAGLLAVDVVAFCLLSCFYTYKSSVTTNGNKVEPNDSVATDTVATDAVAMADVAESDEQKPSTSQTP